VDAVLGRLREDFAGELIGPKHPQCHAARAVWNAAIDREPVLIARCATTADVAASLRAAREGGFDVAVRCGGHSVAGHGVWDDGVVIDLSAMRGTMVDAEALRVSAQGGALLGDVDRATEPCGLVTRPESSLTPASAVSH
jgi:FAD/FMN-containing dehydrogenase